LSEFFTTPCGATLPEKNAVLEKKNGPYTEIFIKGIDNLGSHDIIGAIAVAVKAFPQGHYQPAITKSEKTEEG